MAPIYDSDIAQQRWDDADWERYELWEKVEHRIRRYRRLWIGATIAVFLALSSVPIVLDRSPAWSSLAASRRLGQLLNRMKLDAGRDHAAYRIRFPVAGSLAYQVEKGSSCSDPAPQIVRTGTLVPGVSAEDFALMTEAQGQELGIPGLVREACYDYLAGMDTALRGQPVAGFGLLPSADLGAKRTDRVSLLLLGGPSGDISFE